MKKLLKLEPPTEDEVSRVMAELGRRGGRARTARKVASNRQNLQKALAAKQRLRGHSGEPDAED
jgi:hypothetical protein